MVGEQAGTLQEKLTTGLAVSLLCRSELEFAAEESGGRARCSRPTEVDLEVVGKGW